jgi:hypothetical protein
MALQLVSTVTVGSGGAASIEFTGIPATGKDLLILLSARNTSTSIGGAKFRLNGDTNDANYAAIRLFGNGSTASSNTSYTNDIPGLGTTADTFGNIAIYTANYTSTTNKSISQDEVTENNATTAVQQIAAWSYTSSSAVTSCSIVGTSITFAQYSTASLYIIS